MDKSEIWESVHSERRLLAEDMGAIGDDQWATRSLCTKWTVRDVLAHMTATARMSPASFFPKLAASGFSLGQLQARDIESCKGSSPRQTLSRFEAVITSMGHPPGPKETMLGETILHAEDIRRPLGIHHDYPSEAVVVVANFYKGSNLILGAKRRIQGITLRATDVEWQHGSGPEVSGPIVSIVMSMTGRRAAIEDLAGDGVDALRARP